MPDVGATPVNDPSLVNPIAEAVQQAKQQAMQSLAQGAPITGVPNVTTGALPAANPAAQVAGAPFQVTPPIPPAAIPGAPVAPSPSKTNSVGPVVAGQAPTTKDMIEKIMYSSGAPAQEKQGGFNFGDLLKGASGKLGDFLQRWGYGLQGQPAAETQGDIQRRQAFELQKQQIQSEIAAKQLALENQYQTQRMQIQSQLNMQNLTVEQRGQLQNALAEIDANYQKQLALFGPEYEQRLRFAGMAANADPGAHFVGQ